MGDMGDITGIGAYNGVEMAAKEINLEGGITVGMNSTYYIGVVPVNTQEAAATLDYTVLTTAADDVIGSLIPNVVIGGFRTEAVGYYAPLIMAHNIPFISTGCSYDELCLNENPFSTVFGQGAVVGGELDQLYHEHNPIAEALFAGDPSQFNDTYLSQFLPWVNFYRSMPLNIGNMITQIGDYIAGLRLVGINGSYDTVHYVFHPSENLTTFNVVREAGSWTDESVALLSAILSAYGMHLGVDFSYPLSTDSATLATDMTNFWNEVKAQETVNGSESVTIPLISAVGSQEMLAAYQTVKPDSLICGVDVPGQTYGDYAASGGNCQYEINYLVETAGVNRSQYSVPFYNNYVGNYSTGPTYTAIGSYDAVGMVKNAVLDEGSFSAASIEIYLNTLTGTYEKTGTHWPEPFGNYENGTWVGNSYVGASGQVAWGNVTIPVGPYSLTVSTHDDAQGFPVGYGLFCEWNSTGSGDQMLLQWNSTTAAGLYAYGAGCCYNGAHFPVANNLPGCIIMPSWWVHIPWTAPV